VFYPLSGSSSDDTIMQLRAMSVQHINITFLDLVTFSLLVTYKLNHILLVVMTSDPSQHIGRQRVYMSSSHRVKFD
jgi:hypothetical protein